MSNAKDIAGHSIIDRLPANDAEKQTLIQDTLKGSSHPFVIHNGAICNVNIGILDRDESYQREAEKTLHKLHKKWDPTMVGVIIVSYRDGKLYVVDGWHRVLEALSRGIIYLPACIFTDWTKQKEVEVFLSQMDCITPLKPVDTFKGRLLLGDPTDTAIKNVCDKYGIAIMPRRTKGLTNALTTIGAARKVVDTGGEECLDWMFKLMYDAHWFNTSEAATNKHLKAFCFAYMDGVQKGLLDEYTTRLTDVMASVRTDQFDGFAVVRYMYQESRACIVDLVMDIACGKITAQDIYAICPVSKYSD